MDQINVPIITKPTVGGDIQTWGLKININYENQEQFYLDVETAINYILENMGITRSELQDLLDEGELLVTELSGKIVDGSVLLSQLNNAITIGSTLDATLNNTITTANTANTTLNDTTTTAGTTKTALDLSIYNASTIEAINNLAIALGNDPNFATTITNMIANKLEKGAVSEAYNTAEKIENKIENLFSEDVLWDGVSSTPISYVPNLNLYKAVYVELAIGPDRANSAFQQFVFRNPDNKARVFSSDEVGLRVWELDFIANTIEQTEVRYAGDDDCIYRIVGVLKM